MGDQSKWRIYRCAISRYNEQLSVFVEVLSKLCVPHFKKKRKKKRREQNEISLSNYSLTLIFFNWAKIPISKIYPCKKYNLVVFNIFTNVYNHNHSLISEYFHRPERKSKQSLPTYPFFAAGQPPTYFLSLWLCYSGLFAWMESCNIWPFVPGFFHLV